MNQSATPRPQEPGGLRRALDRWCALLRYHRPSQFARRIAARLETQRLKWIRGGRYARLSNLKPVRRSNVDLEAFVLRKLDDRRRRLKEGHASLGSGTLRLIGVELPFAEPFDWSLSRHPQVDPLWRFHLHYHEYLLDLLIQALEGPSPEARHRVWQILQDWIEENSLSDPRSLSAAWHPFCISRRLPVWVVLLLHGSLSPEVREAVVSSLACQAEFLADHLELDVGGNHLIENVRALAVCGAFLEGPLAERWLERSAEVLSRELSAQILKHGEHFERSPMYHAFVLDAVLDVRDVTRQVRPALHEQCARAARSMAAFLSDILHPDGQIPLLGDSALNEAPHPQELIRAAGISVEPAVQTSPATLHGQTWVFRDGDRFLLFDAGPVGPDALPAHAHCDLLTIEAALAGRRFIVDTGVSTYAAGPLRQHARSTAAHNVLQIDNAEQCDVWSRFRMGRRGHAGDVQTGQAQDFHWASGSHNAFAFVGADRVHRIVACRPGGPWFIMDVTIGRGVHDLRSRLHLHPDFSPVVRDRTAELRIGNLEVEIVAGVNGSLAVTPSCYLPDFGANIAAPVLEWSKTAVSLPAVCGWCLGWGAAKPADLRFQISDSRCVQVRWTEDGREAGVDLPISGW